MEHAGSCLALQPTMEGGWGWYYTCIFTVQYLYNAFNFNAL